MSISLSWQRHAFLFFWYGLELIISQKSKNKFSKLWKVHDRIPILQLARKQKETEM